MVIREENDIKNERKIEFNEKSNDKYYTLVCLLVQNNATKMYIRSNKTKIKRKTPRYGNKGISKPLHVQTK